MKSLLITAILLFPLIGHSGELEKMFNAVHPTTAPVSENSRTFAEIDAKESEITEIGIEHTQWYCLGDAVFTMIIKADGSFVYIGEKNTKHPGLSKGSISTKDATSLFQYVRGLDLFALDDSYSVMRSDQPTVYIMVAKRGSERSSETTQPPALSNSGHWIR